MKVVAIAVLTILAVVAVAMQQGEAVNCGQVDVALAPCANFLTGHEPKPTQKCCDGVKEVKELAVSPDDKRATCGCVKEAATHFSGLVDAAAQSLADDCGVKLDIPVSRTVDCTKYALDLMRNEGEEAAYY